MFKIIKILLMLTGLFIVFSLLKEPKGLIKKSENNQTVTIKKPQAQKKEKSPKDGVTLLEYLFAKKMGDPSVKCQLKQGKSRFFIACKEGVAMKDSYWEVKAQSQKLHLYALNQVANVIVKNHSYKELEYSQKPVEEKLEKALISFFKN